MCRGKIKFGYVLAVTNVIIKESIGNDVIIRAGNLHERAEGGAKFSRVGVNIQHELQRR